MDNIVVVVIIDVVKFDGISNPWARARGGCIARLETLFHTPVPTFTKHSKYLAGPVINSFKYPLLSTWKWANYLLTFQNIENKISFH